MTDRPLEPDEPEEPTEVVEPGEPDEPTEVSEPAGAAEPEVRSEVEEPAEPEEPEASATAQDEPAADETTEVAAAPREERRLERSRDDRVIAGVCGGLGKHFGIDPILVRIAALLLIFAGGVGIVLYLIGWIAIPEERVATPDGVPLSDADLTEEELERRRGAALLGLVFVAVGIFFLLDEVWPDLSWRYIWPAALIAVGFAIVLRGRR